MQRHVFVVQVLDIARSVDRNFLRFGRLDHADKSVVRQRVLEHIQVPGLEYIERQASARKQQHARKREDRNRLRQVPEGDFKMAHENRIEDSFCRPATVSGWVDPMASNILTNWALAASSFQARSRSTISNN